MKTTKKLFLLFIVFTITNISFAQNFQWAQQYGNSASQNVYDVAVDTSGNVYSVGYFYSVMDADPSSGVSNISSNGGQDIFITKVSAAGAFIWAKSIGGTGNDIGKAIAIDKQGNVVVTGNFNSIVDFDPNSGVTNLTSAGSKDIFVLKLTGGGGFLWAINIGSAGDDEGYAIAVDAADNILLTGYFTYNPDFDPGPGTTNLSSAGFADIFAAKYSSAGNFVWAKSIGGTSADVGQGITTDGSNNVILTGLFRNTADFDPSSSTFNLTSAAFSDIFMVKLNSSGTFTWAFNVGSGGDDQGFALTTDNLGNIYTTGFYVGTPDFDPGSGTTTLPAGNYAQIYIAKYSPTGSFIWAKGIGGNGSDLGFAITRDAVGNVFVAGRYSETVNFNASTSPSTLTSRGSGDIFVLKTDPLGNSIWVRSIGGGQMDEAQGIAMSQIGESPIYISGYFNGTVDFNPNSGVSNLTNASGTDGFVLKLDHCQSNSSSTNLTVCGASYLWQENGQTYTTSGIYTANKLNVSGCDSAVSLNLTLNPLPNISVTKTGNILSADAATATYQWIDCNTNLPIPGAINQSYTATVNGSYAVIVNESPCSDTSICFVFANFPNGINSIGEGNNLNIYPNPFNKSILVKANSRILSISILDLTGRSVSQIKDINKQDVQLDLSKITCGSYIIQVETKFGTRIQKIIKQ